MGIQADIEIAGKLRLVKLLGEGSVGHVWLAQHLHLGSEVAVKFLHRDVSADDTGRERFVREARTVARLRSPHIVQVHDFGFHEGRAYLVMEYLVGETLEARMRRVGAMLTIDVARVCTQIAKALQKAHDAGIVHRDIKPANVFLVDYGDEEVAKVVDFGIVKSIDAANLATSTVNVLTQTGSLLGTPYYMSPEQIEDAGRVAHQSDLWSLGVIAYECLVGKHPFAAPNFARLVMGICRNPIPVPSQSVAVSPEFDKWFAQALQRDPAKRFQSARDMARELCHALVFSDADVSMLRGSVPPDLFWSGAFPSLPPVTSVISVGSDRPSRPDSEPSDSSDIDKTLVCQPPLQDVAVREAVLDRIAVLDSNVTSSADGSLGSQVAPKPQVQARSQKALRTALLALGAIVLVAVGWIASRVSHVAQDADPQEPAWVSAASSSSRALLPASTPPDPVSKTPPPAQSTATAIASASAAVSAASSAPPLAPPVKPTATKAVKKPPHLPPPTSTPESTEPSPPPSLDDILKRRQ